MRAQPAQWFDVLEALILEAESLGEGVAWEIDKVRACWDTGAVTAVAVKDGSHLIAYASAMSISPETLNAIVEGRLNPTEIGLEHADVARTHHWIGIVVTALEHRGKGAGRLALEELVGALNGKCIADVYSEGGRALVERLGWRKVRDGEHPIYISGSLPTTL